MAGGQLPRVVVCGTVAVLVGELVARGAAGVAAVGPLLASGLVAGTDTGAGVATVLTFATATVPAIPKNDAMLRPPSNQRVAAAG